MSKACSEPIALSSVRATDSFWKDRMDLVREKMLPYQWEALNDRISDADPSHAISNLMSAADKKEGGFEGFVFQDSDVYKWLEAAAYTIAVHKDASLEEHADDVIGLLCEAQQPDGYLNSYYIINGLDQRFTNLMDNHELYCLGHLIEAAVAYFDATGKDRLLSVALRYVELVDSLIGPEEGKLKGYPGHEIIEMALLRLYKITRDEKHLKLARYFVYQRGQSPLFFEEECKKRGAKPYWHDSPLGFQYYQAAKPVLEQTEAEGHAVRAVYLYSGMASLAKETGDAALFEACQKLWDNIVERRMYITGAIGSSAHGESFTCDYHLPSDSVYGETCAAIGLVFFARRMLELSPVAAYADTMERALYNGVISGMSLDGTRFFYVNPLEVVPERVEKDYDLRHVKIERQKWFGCACCPPNLARLLASLPSYAYTKSDDTLFVHLYMGSVVNTVLSGVNAMLAISTTYPWDGAITLKVSPEKEAEFTVALRIPGWCEDYCLRINGLEWSGSIKDNAAKERSGYIYITRAWKAGDIVNLELKMPVTVVSSNPMVRDTLGKVALSRGPLVYCLEEADNGDNLHLLSLRGDESERDFAVKFEPGLLGGVVTIKNADLKFIPYYAWANRGAGEMTVWVNAR